MSETIKNQMETLTDREREVFLTYNALMYYYLHIESDPDCSKENKNKLKLLIIKYEEKTTKILSNYNLISGVIDGTN
jgi:hypothetical protein